MSGKPAATWMHIGLHGHSVGTFSATEKGIRWKSAMTTDDDDVILSRTVPSRALKGAQWTVFGRSGHVRIQTNSEKGLPHELRFDGFPYTDYEKLKETLQDLYSIELVKQTMSSAGASFGNTDVQGRNLVFRQCILEDADEEGEEFEPRDGDEMMSMNLAEVSQCVLPGNNRNEIELQFHESDTVEAGTDQCVAIRFYIPPDPDADPSDRDAPTSAELFQQRIMKNANIKNTTGDVIVEFDENKGTFLTPRGRYSIELYDSFLRMRGNKYDYKIKYDDISRLFLLPKPDDVHMAFIIALDRPIRQGQQRYQMLVLQTTKEMAEVNVNLDEKTLQKEYNGDLQPVMQGALCNLIAKTFKIIGKKKVFIPGKFANAYQQACVKCALRANEGHLYPLEKSFVFIHKPPVLVRFDEVDSVEFQRYAGGQGSTRNFDLCVNLKNSVGDNTTKEYTFSGIDRSDYAGLYNFLNGKKIRIKNIQETTAADNGPVAVEYNEGQDGGIEDEESSEDEDFESDDGESSSSEDIEDEDLEVDDDDSDLEEARKKAGKEGSKKKRPADNKGDGSSSTKKKKKTEKVKKVEKVEKSSGGKKKKDPDAPKRATSSFMYFCKKMRPKVKEENPDASFGELGKLLGERFRGLSPEEKKIYEDMAKEDKKRYKEEMANYSAPEDDDNGSTSTKPSRKKQTKDPNAPKRGMTSFMYFSQDKRAEIKNNNPDASFGDIGKLVGKAFKALTKEEKKVYEDMAKEDKARYLREMKNYTPPSSNGGEVTKKKKGGKDTSGKKSKVEKEVEAKSDDDSDDEASSVADSGSNTDNDSDDSDSD